MTGQKKQSVAQEPAGLERSVLTTKQLSDLLFNTRWADEFEYKQLELLARHGTAYEAPAKTLILREGARESYMGILLKGKVQIIKSDSHMKGRVIGVLGAGSSFGEMSMIDSEPRSASVIAAQDTVLLVLSEDAVYNIASDNPKFGLKMMFRISKMISQRLRQTSGRLIDHLET